MRYRGYTGAVRCADRAQPGNRALMSWFLGRYAARGGVNLGIFNCAVIPGSATLSVHGEGRADDLGTGGVTDWGVELANALVDYSGELGVQCVIFDRHIWSGSQPDLNLADRDYAGVDPHTGHIHAELGWDAAKFLTAGRVETVLGAVLGHPPLPAPIGDDSMYTFQLASQPEVWAASGAAEPYNISPDTFGDLTAAGIKHITCHSDRSFAQLKAISTPVTAAAVAAGEVVNELGHRLSAKPAA